MRTDASQASGASAKKRKATLRQYQVFDGLQEKPLRRITQHAADLFGATAAALSFAGETRQWRRAGAGIESHAADLEGSLCERVIAEGGPVVVQDAEGRGEKQDGLRPGSIPLGRNGSDEEIEVRFCAGAPLVAENGCSIGALCLWDTDPRALSEADLERLETLATMVVDHLNQQRDDRARDSASSESGREPEAVREKLRESKARYRALAEHFPNGMVALFDEDLRFRLVRGNASGEHLPAPEAVEGRQASELFSAETVARYRDALDGTPSVFEAPFGERLYRIRVVPVSEDPPRALAMTQDITDTEKDRRRLEALVDNLSGLAFRLRRAPGWPLAFVDGQVEEVLGYEPEELADSVRWIEDIVHPEDRERLRRTAEEKLAESGRYDLTYRVVTKEGATRWVRDRGQQGKDPTTGETIVDGLVTDVTEQRERQEALKEAREQIELALEATSSLIFEIDFASGNVVRYGPTNDVIGIGPGQHASSEAYAERVVHPDDRAAFQQAYQALRSGESRTEELTYRTIATDEKRWIRDRVYAYEGKEGGTRGVVGVAQDVTRRKEAEEERRQAKEFYEQVFDQVPVELAVFTPDAQYVSVNASSVEDPERRDQIIGQINEEYCRDRGIDPEIGRRRDEAVRQAAEIRNVVAVEETLDRGADSPRHYRRVHAPIFNDDGDVTHVVGYGIDVTNQWRREEHLREAKEKAQEAVEEIFTQFVSENQKDLPTLEEMERQLVLRALRRCDTQREAADRLGITRRTVTNKLKRYREAGYDV